MYRSAGSAGQVDVRAGASRIGDARVGDADHCGPRRRRRPVWLPHRAPRRRQGHVAAGQEAAAEGEVVRGARSACRTTVHVPREVDWSPWRTR